MKSTFDHLQSFPEDTGIALTAQAEFPLAAETIAQTLLRESLSLWLSKTVTLAMFVGRARGQKGVVVGVVLLVPSWTVISALVVACRVA
jgi:hypothetical protein